MRTTFTIPRLPHLEIRAPATGGVVDDPQRIREFVGGLLAPSGVKAPTVVMINLEGRFLTASALYSLVVPLGQAILSGAYGQIAAVLATSDPATRESIRALAEAFHLPLFVARTPDQLMEAEPVGSLTRGELETLSLMGQLGGCVTVSQMASETGLDQPAAANRLNALSNKHFAYRIERPKSAGHLYMAPWIAQPEDPADPTSGDYFVPKDVREDVRALAELHGRAPSGLIAEAIGQFMAKHKKDLAQDYDSVARALRERDNDSLATYATRYSKKKAQARVRRRRRR
jgi:hypothetical protein